MHCSLQIKTDHKTQCNKSCCDRNETFKYQEFHCNSCIHFAIERKNLNYVHGFIANICNNRTHLHFKELHDSLHSKVPRTAQQIAVYCTASITSSSSSSDDDDSSDERQWKIYDKCKGGAFAWEQECKLLNCSTQEGTANPPSKNPYAVAWFTRCILSNLFCWLSQQPHVCS